MTERLRLPAVYRLVTLDPGEDAREAARALAREDTDDGTLVWAPPMEGDEASENPDIALVLYPESDLNSASQLTFVGGLGLMYALGVLLPSATMVVFEWPGIINVNGGEVARVTLDYPRVDKGETLPWIVLGIHVNLVRPPGSSMLDTAALRDEGCPDVTGGEVIEHFARHFLTWVNRWLDDGFEPVRVAWVNRAGGVGQAIEVPLAKSRAKGIFVDVDAEGRLVLKAKNGHRRRIEMHKTPSLTEVAR